MARNKKLENIVLSGLHDRMCRGHGPCVPFELGLHDRAQSWHDSATCARARDVVFSQFLSS